MGAWRTISTIANATSVGTSVVLPRTASVVAPAVNTAQNANVSTTSGTQSGTGVRAIRQENTLEHVDASTGAFITQYLSNGNVVNQFPSSSVIAYLQAGLTADGLPRVGQKV